VLRAHWGVDDPAKATGTEAEIDAAFVKAYSILRKRIEAFLKLDTESLADKSKLQKALQVIADSII
jgi:arsenate reductase (thioredoxin)